MRYQVVGKNHRVFGKSFGEYFERNLPEAQERHLIGGGFIIRAPLPKKKSEKVSGRISGTLSGFTSSATGTVELPAEPSVSEDAPSEVPEEAPTDNPRRDEF